MKAKDSKKQPVATEVPKAESAPEFDVCFSFAGEDRAYVEQVAAKLKSFGVAVFYDRYEQAELWGKDLYVHLDEVYRIKARYCVIFISENYVKKLWTSHERRSAQARAFEENREYILPARFDDTPVPGILRTVGHISLGGLSPLKFAKLIKAKIDSSSRQTSRISPAFQFRRIYFESFDTAHLGSEQVKTQFGQLWLVGKKGAWLGKIRGGQYHLQNTTKPDASLNNRISYSESGNESFELGDCRVSVKVKIKGPTDAHTGGGLLFRADPGSNNCLSFFLHPGNSVSFAETRAGVLRFLWSQEIPELLPEEFVTLRVVGRGKEIDLFVNDTLLHIAKMDQTAGNPGIHALSVGNFFFDDFSIFIKAV
jgi:hypothetical protein